MKRWTLVCKKNGFSKVKWFTYFIVKALAQQLVVLLVSS